MNFCCCVAMALLIMVPVAWHAAAQEPSQNPLSIASGIPSPPIKFRGFYNSTVLVPGPPRPVQRDHDPTVVADVLTTVLKGNSSRPVSAPMFTFESGDYDKEKELLLREAGCRMACQDHGHCDEETKYCICEYFWTQNPFRIHYHRYESNCDWNVFVVIGTLIGIAFGLLLLSILCHACCRRGTSSDKPYRRYRLLPDDDLEGFGAVGAGMRVPKRVRAQLVDSDDDSETVFEAKNPKYYAKNQYGASEATKAK